MDLNLYWIWCGRHVNTGEVSYKCKLRLGIIGFTSPALLLLTNALAQDVMPQDGQAFRPPAISPRRYSVDQMAAKFARPGNVSDLLKNLKVIMDEDLLLQQSFYEKNNLLNVFDGERVIRVSSEASPNRLEEVPRRTELEVVLNSHHFPGMRVRLSYRRWQTKEFVTPRGTSVPKENYVSGQIKVQMNRVRELSLDEIKKVFGSNPKFIDPNYSPHGSVHNNSDKGALKYETTGVEANSRRAFEKHAIFTIQFRVPPDPKLPGASESITDMDTAKEVDLYDFLQWPTEE